MATPPTRVLSVTPPEGWASNVSPKTTPAFDVQAGDLLVYTAFSEDSIVGVGAPTWTGTGTWTLRQSVVVSNYCTAYLYTCAVTATATGRTVSAARTSGTSTYSFIVSVWRNHGGVGVSGKANTTGAPSLALNCAANSAVVMGNSDWNAIDGASRVWRTVNGAPITESSYGGLAGISYTNYTGYRLDVGTAGSKTVGLSAPAGQKYSIVGVEILGTAGGGSAFTGSVSLSGSGTLSADGSPQPNGSVSLAGSGTLVTSAGKPGVSAAGALSASGTLTTAGKPGVGGAVSLSGSGTLAAAGVPRPGGSVALSGSGTLTTSGNPALSGQLGLSAVGTLSGFAGGFGGSVTFSATGTLTAAGRPSVARTVAFSGAGSLVVAGVPKFLSAVALAGAGALAAQGVPRAVGGAQLSAVGLLTVAASVHVVGSVQLSASGDLVAVESSPVGDVTVAMLARVRVAALLPRSKNAVLLPRVEG